jgi:two-component system cell cycle sensor histidine kinase/response regulator CckA
VTAAIEMVEDLTEKLSLESQVRQSQKMEAIGRLAGGVAHDFNNMLSVIIGYTDLALERVDPAEPLHADLKEISNAASRSTDIVRQLLTFARKQTIAPKVLNLNDTVEGMLKMLRRLIGEDVDLAWLPESGLWPVKMDTSQLEQILANLCVNARDAIDGVGRITIETHNVAIDEAYCVDHVDCVPGQYAMLGISDDGCGMDEESLDKIFEPFFTTKPVGQGTGLGLATVYGIVKQNNGFINVYSERGQGTTFRIYLVREVDEVADTGMERQRDLPLSRGETVLVVEDEASVLELATRMLSSLGYTVLSAGAPGEAMRLAEEHTGEIHLLLTDVILPGMNGRDFAKQIRMTRPAMKCLFMSGYTADVIAHRGTLDEGAEFIGKPFAKRDLAARVRAALEAGE